MLELYRPAGIGSQKFGFINRIPVRWSIYIIHSVDKTKSFCTTPLPTQHHATVSLETTPFTLGIGSVWNKPFLFPAAL